MLAKSGRFVKSPNRQRMRETTDARLRRKREAHLERETYPERETQMSQPLECPRCHSQVDAHGSGWAKRTCPACGSPLVLAAGPAEALVRRYLYRERPGPLGTPPPSGRRG